MSAVVKLSKRAGYKGESFLKGHTLTVEDTEVALFEAAGVVESVEYLSDGDDDVVPPEEPKKTKGKK